MALNEYLLKKNVNNLKYPEMEKQGNGMRKKFWVALMWDLLHFRYSSFAIHDLHTLKKAKARVYIQLCKRNGFFVT